jgi:hypothetical protein
MFRHWLVHAQSGLAVTLVACVAAIGPFGREHTVGASNI